MEQGIISRTTSDISVIDQPITHKKRVLLLFVLSFIPVGLFEKCRTVWYLTPISVVNAYFYLHNFPFVSRAMHTKPLYIEDLKDDDEIDENVKVRYQKYFMQMMHISLALMIGILVNYYFEQLKHTSLSWLELVGLFGGFWSLYTKCQDQIGKLIMLVLQKMKERRRQRRESMSPLNTPVVSPVLRQQPSNGIDPLELSLS